MIKLKLLEDIYDNNRTIGYTFEEVTLIHEKIGEPLPYLVENSKGFRYYIGKHECECVVKDA